MVEFQIAQLIEACSSFKLKYQCLEERKLEISPSIKKLCNGKSLSKRDLMRLETALTECIFSIR